MENSIFIVRDTDLHYTVGVYKTIDRAMKKVIDEMIDAGYTSFNFVSTGNSTGNTYYITFPHSDPECEGHWRIEQWEPEG